MRVLVGMTALATLAAAACTGGCSADDAAVADASTVDAPTDAPQGNCASGEVENQGDWVDYDSTDQMFQGIFDATVAEGQTSATTAPNGRLIICLGAGADHRLSFTHPQYLSMSAAIAAANLGRGYTARGLTPARAAEVLSTELALTIDPADAQILVQLPTGASASIDTLAGGETTVLGEYRLFGNVPVGGGSVSLTITPPSGSSCQAVSTLMLEAGAIAFTAVYCN